VSGVVASAFAVVLLALAARPANAQTFIVTDAPQRGSWELSGGGTFLPSESYGRSTADLTRNGDESAGPVNLFSATSRLDSTFGAQARVGYYLTRAIAVEGGFRYARPSLSVRLSDDFEDAADLTASEQVNQYVFDGSVLFHFAQWSGGRIVPFVSAGAGYIRELHQDNELVETGNEFHAGGGLKFWMGRGARRFGLRVDGGASIRTGGFEFEEGQRRTIPVAGVALMYLF
jgi:hypothetical protein